MRSYFYCRLGMRTLLLTLTLLSLRKAISNLDEVQDLIFKQDVHGVSCDCELYNAMCDIALF